MHEIPFNPKISFEHLSTKRFPFPCLCNIGLPCCKGKRTRQAGYFFVLYLWTKNSHFLSSLIKLWFRMEDSLPRMSYDICVWTWVAEALQLLSVSAVWHQEENAFSNGWDLELYRSKSTPWFFSESSTEVMLSAKYWQQHIFSKANSSSRQVAACHNTWSFCVASPSEVCVRCAVAMSYSGCTGMETSEIHLYEKW